MEIPIKTLHNEDFSITCEETETIEQLKQKIADRTDLPHKYEPHLIKLLYTGKVMENEKTIADYKIAENTHLVIVKQSKPSPPKKDPLAFSYPSSGYASLFSPDALNNSMMSPFFQKDPFMQPMLKAHGPKQHDPFMSAYGGAGAGGFGGSFGNFNHSATTTTDFGDLPPLSNDISTSFAERPLPETPFSAAPMPDTSSTSATMPKLPFPTMSNPGASFSAPPMPKAAVGAGDDHVVKLMEMGFTRAQAKQGLAASGYNMDYAIELLTSGNLPEPEEEIPVPRPASFVPPPATNPFPVPSPSTASAQPTSATPAADTQPVKPLGKRSIVSKNPPASIDEPPSPPALPTASAFPTSSSFPMRPPFPSASAFPHGPSFPSGTGFPSFPSGTGFPSFPTRPPAPQSFQTDPRDAVRMLRNNPAQLQALKETLRTKNPELAQMLDKDPEKVLQLLEQAESSGGLGERSASNPPGTVTVHLSAKDQESVSRLESMGFDRNKVIEAYLCCDKSEEMAANYLINTSG